MGSIGQIINRENIVRKFSAGFLKYLVAPVVIYYHPGKGILEKLFYVVGFFWPGAIKLNYLIAERFKPREHLNG
jgi:hypothetical protein